MRAMVGALHGGLPVMCCASIATCGRYDEALNTNQKCRNAEDQPHGEKFRKARSQTSSICF